MKYPKFLIYNQEILIGRVGLHRELLPKDFKMELVCGGGLFIILNRSSLVSGKKTIHLYGKSEEFGRFIPELALALPFERAILEDYTRTISEYE